MRRRPSRFGGALLLGATVGCLGTVDEPGVTVVDSAGIEIVTNRVTLREPSLRTIPDIVHREIVDEAFYRITAIRPLPEGRLAVGVDGGGVVLLFDEAGHRTATLGGTGDGPGEFRSIGDLMDLPGDSLGVYDPQLKRLTVLAPSGGTPRVLSLAEVAPDRGWARALSLEGGFALVGVAGLGGRGSQGVYRNKETSYRIDREGTVRATYGEFPGLEAFSGGGMAGRAPFGALLVTATGGDQLILGTGEHPEIRTYGPDGALRRIVRWADVDRTVSQARMERFVAFNLSQLPPDQATALSDRLAAMPFAPRMPAHAEVLLSADGSMWVGEYPGPEVESPGGPKPARTWVVFSRDGVMEERVATPEGFVPVALAGDLVWGVYWDELDVESVRAYGTGR